MKNDKKGKKFWWQEAVTFFYAITGWIVAPIILALVIGNYLDQKYETESKYLLICVGIAFVISNVGLILQVIKYKKQISLEDRTTNQNHGSK